MARKESTKMSRAVSQLEHIYNKMNMDFFGGSLPLPIITVQSSPRSYGHFTTSKVWKRKDSNTYELNISAEVLDIAIEETLDTMLHEMVHLYCKENGIQDVSRGGKYHNKRFKAEAERVGLECYETSQYGWNTRAGDRMIQYALDNEWSEIKIARETQGMARPSAPVAGDQTTTPVQVGGGKRTSSTRKYVCPVCGQSIRATKDVNIICGNCMVTMVKA